LVRAVAKVPNYDADMVTRIYAGRKRRLFLKEHREAKKVSAETLAGRLEIDRVSVHRWEREPNRLTPDKQAAYAHALGLEPEDLWRPPEQPSVDALLAQASDDLRRKAAEMVAILLKTGTNN
jgi:transcriptional regulator with XRE-family HTH domain